MATNDIPTPFIPEEILKQDDEEEEADINTILINLVKENACIYDAKDTRHRDRNLLERIWVKIASQIDMTVEEAKTKWQRMRNNFGKAIERRQKTPRSGSAATKLKRPWMYEAQMEFIRDHLNYKRPSPPPLKRKLSVVTTTGDNSQSQSSELTTLALSSTAVDQTSDNEGSASETISMENSKDHIQEYPQNLHTQPLKSRKYDANDFDSAIIPLILKAAAKAEEDPAVGWFKGLLPIFNTLSPIEQLEFQSNMTLELRGYLVAKQQKRGLQE